ncbi:MAG: class I SAM-dependent methyltransferase [Actinobacteria bacterium]|nr:class I SAM-dependent methyltransferase [Actinomycetota bacterium]
MSSKPLRPAVSRNTEASTRSFQAKYARLFNPGQTVLDIGCGQGEFLELLRDRGINPIGVDISEEALFACQKKGLEIHNADAFVFLTANPHRFDGIFASHFIEHFTPPDVLHFFELCGKSLKPGGLIIIVTPNTSDLVVITQWFWLDPTHVRPYPMELVKSLLSQSGFSIETAMEDKQTVGVRGMRQRVVDSIRRVTTVGLAGRGDIFVSARKEN